MQEEETVAESRWGPFLDRLDDFQIWQLHMEVLANLDTRRRMNSYFDTLQPGYDQEPAGSQSQFASRSPTLQPSVRSSIPSTPVPGRDSLPGDDVTLTFANVAKSPPTRHAQRQDAPLTLGNTPETKQTGRQTTEDCLQKGLLNPAPPTRAAPSRSKKADPSMKGPFFCTYCHEMHSPSSFKMKADWKRHETKFHETGFEWPCKVYNCSETFSRKEDLNTHAEKVHGHVPDTHDVKLSLPAKRVYACGFKGCQKLTYTWKERCNHIARCMLEVKDQQRWSYHWRILNLLRQDATKPGWKVVKSRWCERLGIQVSDLRWEYRTSRNLVQQLECQTYGTDMESFLERLFKLGLPRQGPSNFGSATQRAPATIVHPTGTSSTSVSRMNNSSGHSILPASRLSFADQRHIHHHNQAHQEPAFFESILTDHNLNQASRPHSVVMEDAPDVGFGTVGTSAGCDPSMFDDQLLTVNDFLLLGGYCTNATPPLSTSPLEAATAASQDTARTSPGSRIMRKSKDILSPKRSPQPARRIVTDHPDLTPDYTVPGPARERRRSVVANVYGMPFFYGSFQSWA
ncbi:uncharacterized protein EI97DRAFT_71692 [Westerdykella ornata]|uniref:C2H2-type domain-containing protein n=1 Tax=Westerdykella ornata TaxID=318751 RepID=A0A6A6JI50_WESOR|nr:uncharacterized protein EI97DRAFT_71692 [Westerdykella ornata]KAF2275763.1 hypothetical protein EI97DRAFT_71692 [Westerdykella ornata]